MSDVPEDLKAIAPYLKRAEELDERDPVMAYYCRYYAVTVGLTKRTPQNKAVVGPYLMKLLDKLESDKATKSADFPAIADDQLGKEHVLAFASKIFLRSDNEDRAGNATSKTARNFFIAATFLEVLNHFGPIDEEIEKRIKYAKWKAADILKAEKEGRRPIPGPPGGDDSLSLEGVGGADAFATSSVAAALPPAAAPDAGPWQDAPAPPSSGAAGAAASSNYGMLPSQTQTPAPAGPPYPSGPPSASPTDQYAMLPPGGAAAGWGAPAAPPHQQYGFNYLAGPNGAAAPSRPPPAGGYQPSAPGTPTSAPTAAAPVHAPPPATVHAASAPAASPSVYGAAVPYDPAELAAASKHARHAISALQYDDVPTAIDLLEKALARLRGLQPR